MSLPSIPSEADILTEVVAPEAATMGAEVARLVLQFRFDRKVTQRIRQLLTKNNRGTISADERIALERYLRVGQFLDLLHAKARLSLRAAGRFSEV